MIISTGTARLWIRRRLTRQGIRKAATSMWLIVAFGGLVLAGYQVGTGRWHATPVLSGSMRPGFQPGDVVVTKRVPVSDLRVRDVVVFHAPNAGQRQTVHRITKLTVKDGTTSITTWGDANLTTDPEVSSLKGSTAYRVVRVVPLVGYPAVWLQAANHGGLVIALGVLLLILAAVIAVRPVKRDAQEVSEPSCVAEELLATVDLGPEVEGPGTVPDEQHERSSRAAR